MIAHNRNIVVALALVVSTMLILFTYHSSGGTNNLCNNLYPKPEATCGTPQQSSQGQQQEQEVQTFTGGKPRYIFVDLGANKADTLEVFLKQYGAKFKYNYPRPEWATYEQAEIYLFEANPVFNPDLVAAKEKYDALGVRVHIYPSTVVGVRDGIQTFYLDTVNSKNDYWGSSIYADHPDALKSQAKGTELTSINIATWLLRNTLPRDFVVVKMDIEGAEYEVVPHLAEMGAWAVIDHLLIEWHPATLGVGTDATALAARKARVDAAIEKFKKEKVEVPEYNSSA